MVNHVQVERVIVPKVLVVFLGDDASVAAEAAAAGAKSVRFTEVDVRSLLETHTKHRRLTSGGDVEYDGVVLAATREAETTAQAEIVRALEHRTTENTVFASIDSVGMAAGLAAVLGGIVVWTKPDLPGDQAATALGARVAKVAGWVRHGLGHEAESHTHSHGHHHHH